MPTTGGPSRRFVLLLLLFSAAVSLIFISSFRAGVHPGEQPNIHTHASTSPKLPTTTPSLSAGNAIAPKLGNETLKAELGRASWKLFHTVLARFPDTPTLDEQDALRQYIHLFQRLYPCGECSNHFQKVLEKFPPQVSSRSNAAVWGCHVHNEVNKSLGKEVWDCSNIGEFYDCGCAEDGEEGKDGIVPAGKGEISAEQKEKLTGSSGRAFDGELFESGGAVRLEKDG